MEEPDERSPEKEFFEDLSNYVPLGTFISAYCNIGPRFEKEFQETNHFPKSLSQITVRAQRLISGLCRKRLIRLFTRECNGSLFTRVYALPNDVGRSFVAEDKSLRPCLLDLMRHLDNSPEAWSACRPKETSSYDLKSRNHDSLFYIFNRLPSPNTSDLVVSCPHSQSAIRHIVDHENLRGLKTSLYPYQKRTVATMIKREVQPARTLDPRLQPLTGPTGATFYLDSQARCIFRDRREYDEACGGILGESMGLGKTLICLSMIISTKGHWPSIPPEYSLSHRPLRQNTASLMETAAAAVAQACIPWKSYFHEMLTSGDDLANCRALLEKNVPFYEKPTTISCRNTRRPGFVASHKVVKLCSATLVVVPQNLLSQWKSEIARHIEEGELAVLYLDTPGNVLMPSAEQLQRYDVILITRQRLEREMVPPALTKGLSNGKCKCPNGQICPCLEQSQYHCPLKDLHFLRVIMDEGHEFSSYSNRNNTYWALLQLQVDRKWVVSGTPSSGLIGVEVGAAATETTDSTGVQSNKTHAAILQCRKKETALAQERKDLEKLGGLVVGFLKLQPWANTGHDFAIWSKHIMPSADGIRKPGSLRKLLESLVVRHRIEDVEVDLKLPPLYNRVVYLTPSWHDKISINLFALALVTNFVTSERKDEDYMFHPRNKRFLNSLIVNLRRANFYWTSWTPEQVKKTIQASRAYLQNHISSGTMCLEQDRQLLQQGIDIGELILQFRAWEVLSKVHEMGIFIENFPDKARHAWALVEPEGKEPLMSSTTQMIEAQDWVDVHVNLRNVEAIKSALSDEGIKATQKLWLEENTIVDERIITHRRPRPVGPAGIPQLTQKQTISRVKAPSKQSRLTRTYPISKPVPNGSMAATSKPSVPSIEATSLPETPLAETKIIGTTSAKLSYLLDQLARLHTTEKILVFYEGDHIAYYIAQALEILSIRHLIYTGTLSSARQSVYITTFNSTPTFRVLLMDVHHAAHGLHIASASRVFFVNPIWQPNVEAQAIKRAHRIGQTKPVYVETLVLEGTFEDQMFQRRKRMTAEEHQKAEKSLLDDDTMSTIILNASFTPFDEQEVQNVRHQIAMLQTPQQLFGRPDRPIGNVNDRDADLIFPEGTPKQGRKRKTESKDAPDMAASPRSPKKSSPGSRSPLSSPLTQRTPRMNTVMDTVMGGLDATESPALPQYLATSLPFRPTHFAIGDSEPSSPSGLFGGPLSPR